MNKKPILVILAAGMGSRYGGLKQMEKFGAGGEVLMDYSVFDALRSGFGKIVFVIRRDIENDFRELVLSRLDGHIKYDVAFQSLDAHVPADIYARAVVAGRTKPWGTAHAVLCAADKIDAPFCVINADDFYGRDAFREIGEFFAGNQTDGAIVPYRLDETLSEFGTVSRADCKIENGFLTKIVEMKKIARAPDGKIYNEHDDETRSQLADDTPVSMNFFGYPESILPHFAKYFSDFINAWNGELKSECFMPIATGEFIKRGDLKMYALPSVSGWFGVTYPEDRAAAAGKIESLTASGEYPKKLWE
ncbi:MAG: NTP transferase domain-containing protein [Rickettsiales bacterium]|jgi:NDP-sugar pyrophosphorylase family protein|nr:NTP transferase domain-containing protein [Rickettsiales bacterium]